MGFTYSNLYECSMWSGSWQYIQLHFEIASINIRDLSLWYMHHNPVGPPIIMEDHQIYCCLSQDTICTIKGNTKSSFQLLTIVKSAKYQPKENRAGKVTSKFCQKTFSWLTIVNDSFRYEKVLAYTVNTCRFVSSQDSQSSSVHSLGKDGLKSTFTSSQSER